MNTSRHWVINWEGHCFQIPCVGGETQVRGPVSCISGISVTMFDNLIFLQRFPGVRRVAKFDPFHTFCHSIVLRFHGATTGLPSPCGEIAAEKVPRSRLNTTTPMRIPNTRQRCHSSSVIGINRRAQPFVTPPAQASRAAARSVCVMILSFREVFHRAAL